MQYSFDFAIFYFHGYNNTSLSNNLLDKIVPHVDGSFKDAIVVKKKISLKC